METDINFNSEDQQLSGTWYKAEGQEKAAIFILGGGANLPHKDAYYPAWQRKLAQEGISSFSFDFRGVGETKEILSATNISSRIEDARTAFATFQPNTNSKIYLLGISMGGPVAIALAESAKPSGIILIVPAAYSTEAHHKNFGPDFSTAIRKPHNWDHSPDFELLQEYQGKVLLAYAGEDKIVPKEIYSMYSDIVNKKGEILVIPNVEHSFMRKSDPESIHAQEILHEHLVNFVTRS